ncbi:MAG: diphosphatase [Actinomycetota bacterium]|jgi:NAD+ diphosphatase|nr:diphosphatase [Actinomycetota bacterium]
MASRRRRTPNPLSTQGLDRLGLLRKDPERLADHLRSTAKEVRTIPIVGGQVCLDDGALVYVDHDHAEEDTWLLGQSLDDGVVYFATTVATDAWQDDRGRLTGLREVAALLPPLEGNLLAMATGLATWHATHQFCGRCGAPTQQDWSGHRRRCTDTNCNREHFPRTDPAIIVAVTSPDDGNRILLGRNPAWPRGFASVLAGFVEPGESLEDAVAREIKEEAGIDVDPEGIDYHSSQPWPFPASVMLGFTARATTDELDPDPEELADAEWYTRDEVGHGAVGLPPPLSISRRLVDDWLEEDE